MLLYEDVLPNTWSDQNRQEGEACAKLNMFPPMLCISSPETKKAPWNKENNYNISLETMLLKEKFKHGHVRRR